MFGFVRIAVELKIMVYTLVFMEAGPKLDSVYNGAREKIHGAGKANNEQKRYIVVNPI